ncbi:MAG: lipopolysaccharide transport periplasmic protein LptA [Rhodocyclaceae bacterium]|nr:lipopolysaccharide transport periplasmic protein LptA [Rhodocyclaceae bacterium]
MKKNRPNAALRGLVLLACLFVMPVAFAEKADKDKPVNLEADRITVDDARKVQVLDGNVQLVRGTLVIRTDKLVVTQDADGFQRGVAYGGADGLAHFRQKREGKDEYVEGEAERLEHNAKTDVTELFGRAYVKSGLDEVRGQYIQYNGTTENYLVTSGPNGTSAAAKGKPDRVHAVIQPRNGGKAAAPAAQSAAPPLKAATDIASPSQE